MNIRQLRALGEVLKHGMHISAAAKVLHTSQSGVSKQILELEDELGVTIFLRRRNRVIALTEAGIALAPLAERIVKDAERLQAVAADYNGRSAGNFVLATTHLHARHTLPAAIREFTKQHPEVSLQLLAGTPTECCRLVTEGVADLAITLPPDSADGLIAIPVYRLKRHLVAPVGHPLLSLEKLDLSAIARYPLVTYDDTFRSRRIVKQVFEETGLHPTVALQAIDPEICKTYVAMGLGVSILPEVAFDPEMDVGLAARDAGHLFESGVVNVYVRRGDYLRKFVYRFLSLFSPHLTHQFVEQYRDQSREQAADSPLEIPFARRNL
jgi:LysR family cys regulon transcriptional activator